MRHHIFIAIGLLVAVVFAYRGAIALTTPGLGLAELYALGGLVIAAALIGVGLSEWRAKRAARED